MLREERKQNDTKYSVKIREDRKKRKLKKYNKQNSYKHVFNPTISIINLNVHILNIPTIDSETEEGIKKQDPIVYYL